MARNKQDSLFGQGLFGGNAPVRQTDQPRLRETQRVDWLRLIRTPRIGPATFRDLLNHFGSAEAAIAALEAGAVGKRRFMLSSVDQARAELEMTRKAGALIVAPGEMGYPPALAQCEGAPPLITIFGRREIADQAAIAIVGSRNASATGLKFAAQLAGEFGAAGYLTVSGLARGIDTAVHQGSLNSGTIAVLAGGIDHIYPRQNERLFHEIAETGLIITEQALGFTARAQDFPRRNRLISGIALATVVVEAAMRSGSLTTARFAGEQGRDVFAVPGHPLDPRAAGTNRLIQEGAGLVARARDVLEQVNDVTGFSAAEAYGIAALMAPERQALEGQALEGLALEGQAGGGADCPPDEEVKHRLIEMLGPAPIDRDSLIRLLGCSAPQLQIALLELDLDGRLEHHGAQCVSLRPA